MAFTNLQPGTSNVPITSQLLGRPSLTIKESRDLFNKTNSLIPCSPPAVIDPRATMQNGCYVSLRRLQKHFDDSKGGRLQALQARRTALCKLLAEDREQYMSALLPTGRTLYTDTFGEFKKWNRTRYGF